MLSYPVIRFNAPVVRKRKLISITVFTLIFLLYPDILFPQGADIRILRSINSPESLNSDNFFRFVSDSHGYIVAGVPLSAGLTGIIRHDDDLKVKAIEMIEGIGVNLGVTIILKYSFKRDRPFVTYPDIVKKSGAASPSFPSGHTSSAFETATALSLSFPKWYIIAPSCLWACTVGYSRMHLGVHYPSDVLAGAIIGSGSAYITHLVNKKLNIKYNRILSKK